MSANLLQCLDDTAQIRCLDAWLRNEIQDAITEIRRVHGVMADTYGMAVAGDLLAVQKSLAEAIDATPPNVARGFMQPDPFDA